MKNILVFLVTVFVLAGCASYKPTIPDSYTGSRASVKDTVNVYSDSKADFFYISDINGEKIESSLIVSRRRNQGRGMKMTPVVVQHDFATQATTLSIVGRTEYAAPILALSNAVYEVRGTVGFTPEPNKIYLVRGELGENYSAIWVEEESSKTIVGKKIEVKGSAKLGMFEK